MPIFELKAEIAAAAAESADNVLLEYSSGSWSVLEDVIAKRAWLVGINSDATTLQREWQELTPLLRAAGIDAEPHAEPRPLADADWRESYKAHFRAWQFGRLHWVPVWERAKFTLPPGEAVLWLDPGLAFGTGNHETTRLCIERLVAIEGAARSAGRDLRELRVVDAGCGSGILALSAALLGFGRIAGFDNDPEAVRVAEENATANGLSGRVDFYQGDLVSGLAGRQCDVVLANIQSDVLMRFARELVAAVAPGGTLILSGILAVENAQVRSTFAAAAPAWRSEARTMGEWSDVVLQRPA